VAGNRTIESGFIAGVFLSGATVTVTNSIFAHNYRDFDGVDVSVSGTGGGVAYSITQPARAGTGNSGADPEFMNPATSDYRLRPGSPAIDAGTEQNWMSGVTDFAGNPRILNGIPDMGAYESEAANSGVLRINFIANRRQGYAPLSVVYTSHVAGVDQSGLYYRWDFDNDGDYEFQGSGHATTTWEYGPGTHTVRLVVSNASGVVESLIKEDYIKAPSMSVYVWSGGDNTSGDGWATAFTNPTLALAAAIDSNTIHLAGETFEVSAALVWSGVNDLTIIGGYNPADMPAGPVACQPTNWPTVLRMRSGVNSRVLDVAGISGGRLQGVTIRDGNTPTDSLKGVGGGMRVLSSSLVIEDCVFTNNQSNAGGNGLVWGGGIYANASTITLSRVSFRNNRAKSTPSSNNNRAMGGGVAAEGGKIHIQNCLFIANDADAQGHFGSRGGAVYFEGGTHSVQNCLMALNRTGPNRALGAGGAVYLNNGVTIENCTIVTNRIWHATAGSGGGVYRAGGSVTNCIIMDNWNVSTASRTDVYTASEAVFGYNCSPDLTAEVNGNINADPQFTDPAANDYTLLRSSPCRNAGVKRPWMSGTRDLAGNPRVLNNLVDIGCYEVVPIAGFLLIVR